VFPTPETIRTDTGLPGRPLIVEQTAARPRHLSVFAAQLVAPFRPMRDEANRLSIRDELSKPAPDPDGSSPQCGAPAELTERNATEDRIMA
jgi:hypothetical protein